MIEMLYIDGTPWRERFQVFVNHAGQKSSKPAALTLTSFVYLTRLAVAAADPDSDGWVEKEDIDPSHNVHRYVYRTRKEIWNLIGVEIENNQCGSYRLKLGPRQIGFNYQALKAFPDMRIRELFGG